MRQFYNARKSKFTKFAHGKHGAKKGKTTRKSKAKMVNTVFATQFTSGCKFGGKRGSYHLCPLFDRSLDLFCTIFAMSKFV